MKKVLAIVLVLLVQLGFSQNHDDLSLEKRKIVENLKQIEDLYISKLNFEERRKAIELLNDVLRKLYQLDDSQLNNCGDNNKFNHNSIVLNDEGFKDLYDQVKNELNEDHKTKLIQSIGKDGLILSSQLAKLIQTYNFESGKVKCIKAIYKNIYDKANIGMVLKHLMVKDEIIEFINDK